MLLKELNFYYYTHKLGKLVRTKYLVDSYANASKIPLSEILIPKVVLTENTIYKSNNILENVADSYFRSEVLLCCYVEIFKNIATVTFAFTAFAMCFSIKIILTVFDASVLTSDW